MAIGQGSGALTNVQPQVAQLELTFAGPLVKDSVVNSSADLPNLPVLTNYAQKLVWSLADRNFWYISNGDGSLLSHWTKYVSPLTIEAYDPAQSAGYTAGSVVYQNGVLYKAIQDAPFGTDPSNATYWLAIAGEYVTFRFAYVNMSTWVVVTTVKNPNFEIVFGDIQYTDDTDTTFLIGDDGMISVLNQKIVQAFKAKQVAANTWNIYFEENEAPFLATGVVNIK
jgi:hypothetical protein